MVTAVGRVYAEALFAIAKERSQVEEIGAELDEFVRLVEGDPPFALFLSTPVLEPAVKIAHLKKAFENNVSTILADFVCLLVEKGRAGALASIAESYRSMADEFANRTRVQVRSARPLNDALRAEIEELLRTSLEKNVALEADTTPSLMGGAVITIGDKVYDGSVKNRLAQFRKQIMRSGGYEAQG